MTTINAKETKPYILIFKKDRPSLSMTEVRGEQLAKWWLGSRPSEKTAIYDDRGNFQEILQSSEISWIGRKGMQEVKRDEKGRSAIQGFRCDWGTWHPMDGLSLNCECWTKFDMHHSRMFRILREKWPNIHTRSDITEEMQNYILFVYQKTDECL